MVKRRNSNLETCGRVRLLVTRVHDVLTDGTAYFSGTGVPHVRFSVCDGRAIGELGENDVRVIAFDSARLTIEGPPLTTWKLAELDLNWQDPEQNLRQAAERFGVPLEEVGIITAQREDLPLLKLCGVSFVPAGSDDSLCAGADYVLDMAGGRGVLARVARIISEHINNQERPELSVIVPAYNEAERIEATIDSYYHFFSLHDFRFELVVVLNGCRDDTLAIVGKFAKAHPGTRYVTFPKPLGKGGAIIEGFRLVSGRFVAYVDADGATRADELSRLLDNVGDYDGIMGSRWLPDSAVLVPQSLTRRIASRGFNLCARWILGLPFADTQCGSKIIKREVVTAIVDKLSTTNMAFDACMLYHIHRAGYRIKEFPIAWSDKGGSKVSLRKHAPGMLWALIRTRLAPARVATAVKQNEEPKPE